MLIRQFYICYSNFKYTFLQHGTKDVSVTSGPESTPNSSNSEGVWNYYYKLYQKLVATFLRKFFFINF